ncbi:MAG TPA: multicopper oxidase domain-containing protein [Longimicrobiales bacterium]|nr:multicopper oxidase domain-containing protein [Longimicrobiales bacterium]
MLLPIIVALLAATNPETISTNDMRTPAGKLSNGVLTLQLEARNGMWYPDGMKGMPRPVAAFAEVGNGLQVPGPLLRVSVGTEVRITLRNSLEQPLWIFGLGAKRGIAADSFVIAPNATREVTFKATEAGLYYYAGKFTPAPLLARGGPDSQLNGMIVVDPPGAKANDQLFMISWWFGEDSASVSGLTDGSTIVINGLSWPHTQRLQATQGEQLTWRWVNTTIVPHPMHLHGFYFDVIGTGDGASYQQYAAADARKTVTELMMPGTTMSMTWTPVRPGNWIMHCHFAGHMTSIEGMNKDRRYPEAAAAQSAKSSHDHHNYMAGLVMAITVKPRGEMKASAAPARDIRLIARSKARGYGEYTGSGYVLGGSASETDRNTINVPGPLLVLQKDQPVAVNIINQTHEPAAVHWHGIELESFPDGVPGVSGYGKNLLPSIMPGDSFTVRFIPPRAGTFMYHSHSNEFQQLSSGMSGAIVVLEPGQSFDAERDKVFLFSDNGPTVNVMKGPYPHMTLNGKTQPDAMELKAGTTYRFRMINIRAEAGVFMNLLDGEELVQWKMVARDGADLPTHQVKVTPARWGFASGQIADFEFTPTKAGVLRLKLSDPPDVEGGQPPVEMVINVR